MEYPIACSIPRPAAGLYFAGGEMVEILGLTETERLAVVEQMSRHLFDYEGLVIPPPLASQAT